jgi:CRISPR-associated protein Csd2
MRAGDSVERFVPQDVRDLYEVISVRGAAALLHTNHLELFEELLAALRAFRFPEAYALMGGGNGSRITGTFKTLFQSAGWKETRIAADLLVKKYHGKKLTKPVEEFMLEGYVGGHKIDFVKGRVAVDFEWNSKDQTYDRDLYAARAFYECGVIDAFVIVTRSEELNALFARLGISKKYGASTTWMGKLLPRIDGGRNGGCPVLIFGITPRIVTASDPADVRAAALIDDADPEDEDDA